MDKHRRAGAHGFDDKESMNARCNSDKACGVAAFSAAALRVEVGVATLTGDLEIPECAGGLVIFAHGSGSSRLSPRNQFVAQALRDAGSGTFLFDILTSGEEEEDARTGALRFDIELLAMRLVKVTQWLMQFPATRALPFAYFGASTGAAAALRAAAILPSRISAIVSRGGRPDLATDSLEHVRAATLFIVGAQDHAVLRMNQRAFAQLECEKDFLVLPRATHLFEEPGALEDVAKYSATFFRAAWRRAALGDAPASGLTSEQ
jgi:pimeloyl-ACP methyl ester carboxylesterase